MVYRILRFIERESKRQSDNNESKIIKIKKKSVAIKNTKGKHLLLVLYNIDHFNIQARSAFFAGYTLAMQAAVKSSYELTLEKRQEKLVYAYSLLAFACHYLTDAFSSGHMRTPRRELYLQFGPVIGGLFSLFQHEEDGSRGLEVSSKKWGEKESSLWTAYGDKHLFEEKSKENHMRVLQAVQLAIKEVYQAYITRKVIVAEESVINKLIPIVTENNFPPLFKVDQDGKVVCREPVSYTFYKNNPHKINENQQVATILTKK